MDWIRISMWSFMRLLLKKKKNLWWKLLSWGNSPSSAQHQEKVIHLNWSWDPATTPWNRSTSVPPLFGGWKNTGFCSDPAEKRGRGRLRCGAASQSLWEGWAVCAGSAGPQPPLSCLVDLCVHAHTTHWNTKVTLSQTSGYFTSSQYHLQPP